MDPFSLLPPTKDASVITTTPCTATPREEKTSAEMLSKNQEKSASYPSPKDHSDNRSVSSSVLDPPPNRAKSGHLPSFVKAGTYLKELVERTIASKVTKIIPRVEFELI